MTTAGRSTGTHRRGDVAAGRHPLGAQARRLLEDSAWTPSLTPQQSTRLDEELFEQHVSAGTHVMRRGERVEGWFGVAEGIVKVVSVAREGKTMTHAAFTTGAWFGEASMLWTAHAVAQHDAKALADSRLVCIPYATFEWLQHLSIDFNRFIARQLAMRVAQVMSVLERSRLTPPETRLAQCLQDLVDPRLNPGAGLRIALTQEEIGLLCGLSRPVVNRALRLFESLGIVKLEYGEVSITSPERLRAASRGPWDPTQRS